MPSATFLRHTGCDYCGSSDAGALYSDGGFHCFSCKKTVKNMDEQEAPIISKGLLTGTFQDIPNRSLKEETCRHFGYMVGDRCHIAPFHDDTGKVVAQKIRKANKEFSIVGDTKALGKLLFGKNLWGTGGKSVTITEGEIDCLSVSQAFNNRWPVVSIPNGAQGAVKAILANYEWLDSFDKIVLCFDQDDPGQEAAQAVAEVLPAGKAFVMRLPRKDANEVLTNDGPAPIISAFWNAHQWRPDGIRSISELRDDVLNPVELPALPYPWSGFNARLGGIRKGELVTVGAGSGLGKSTLCREILYHLLITESQPVGAMFLEESNRRTVEHLLGIHLNKNLVVNRNSVSHSELSTAFDAISTKPLHLWDHFGSNDVEAVIAKIRYMVRSLGVQWLVLDHLSILVSGLDIGDERRTIDVAMTKLRTLVSELGIGMFLVSHLKRPNGDRGHEDGAEVHAGQFRGSHSIIQLSDAVIGLQKNPDDPLGNILEAVCLKNRFSGDKGSMGLLMYDRDTGRLKEADL